MEDYKVPANHIKFKAKKIDDAIEGKILNSSIAYIEPDGGGPEPSHTHEHDHYFIVIEGCATIKLADKKIFINSDESIRVKGSILHSVWNESSEHLKMIGMTITPTNDK